MSKDLQLKRFEIVDFAVKNPHVTQEEIAVRFECSEGSVKRFCHLAGVLRPRGVGSPSYSSALILNKKKAKLKRLERSIEQTKRDIAKLEAEVR